ncbi:MAG: peptide-methionine (S)-S-oxide reductase MsrA [Actinomycetota bacterium]
MKATFGAGCFWGVEHAFRQVPGVIDTGVGFAGGKTENPSYKDVCGHRTGHAEVVQVDYDPEQVSYRQLLDVFFQVHNPTTKNRQGFDLGSQYRSVVFYHDEAQRAAALATKDAVDASGKHRKKVVTQIEPAPTFWRAEEYHQRYYDRKGITSCDI